MLKTLSAAFFLTLFIFSAGASSAMASAAAARPIQIFIRLQAQVWEKESTRTHDSKYYPVGPREPLSLRIQPDLELTIVKRVFVRGDLEVLITFYQVSPEKGLPYVSTQTRITHRKRGLLAECSRYDALKSPDIGIGSCSGVLDGHQIGVSFLKD